MVLDLPTSFEIDGIERKINPDFRNIIKIIIALNNNEFSDIDKLYIVLNLFYEDGMDDIIDKQTAVDKAFWFIDWGKEKPANKSEDKDAPKLMDWEHDYSMICAAVNNVLKQEIREMPYLHWWTFLGYFTERGKCQYSTILEIRDKINKGQKLEKHEKEILRENRELIVIKDNDDKQFEDEIFGGD